MDHLSHVVHGVFPVVEVRDGFLQVFFLPGIKRVSPVIERLVPDAVGKKVFEEVVEREFFEPGIGGPLPECLVDIVYQVLGRDVFHVRFRAQLPEDTGIAEGLHENDFSEQEGIGRAVDLVPEAP